MIVFLFIVLTGVLWALFAWCDENDYYIGAYFSALFGALCSLAVVVFLVLCCTKGIDAKDLARDRDYYQDCVSNLSENMSFDTVDRIMTRAQYINERIANNKEHADDIMVGPLYNKKIGEIELIEMPDLRLKNFRQDIYDEKKEE